MNFSSKLYIAFISAMSFAFFVAISAAVYYSNEADVIIGSCANIGSMAQVIECGTLHELVKATTSNQGRSVSTAKFLPVMLSVWIVMNVLIIVNWVMPSMKQFSAKRGLLCGMCRKYTIHVSVVTVVVYAVLLMTLYVASVLNIYTDEVLEHIAGVIDTDAFRRLKMSVNASVAFICANSVMIFIFLPTLYASHVCPTHYTLTTSHQDHTQDGDDNEVVFSIEQTDATNRPLMTEDGKTQL